MLYGDKFTIINESIVCLWSYARIGGTKEEKK